MSRRKIPPVVVAVMRMLHARGVPIKILRAELAPHVSYEAVRFACRGPAVREVDNHRRNERRRHHRAVLRSTSTQLETR